MNQRKKLADAVVLLFLFSMLLTGCGGGGGGSTPGVTYSGLTTPAVITQANVQEVTLDAMDGTEVGSIAGGGTPFTSVSGVNGQSAYGAKDIAAKVLVLKDLILQLDPNSFPDSIAARTESASEAGPCGGTLSGIVNVNDVTGAFSATISFNSYRDYDLGSFSSCSAGTGSLINGSMSLSSNSGFLEPSQAGTSMSMNFSAFSFSDATSSVSLAGSATVEFLSATESQTTLNMVASDNLAGKNFKIENYQLLVNDFGSYETEEISGRFYNSAYGYVDIETLIPVETELNADWPRAGEVRFTGAQGGVVTVTFGVTSATGNGTDSQGNSVSFEYIYASN